MAGLQKHRPRIPETLQPHTLYLSSLLKLPLFSAVMESQGSVGSFARSVPGLCARLLYWLHF